MAVKDFIQYYKEEEAQYNEMLEDAKDLEDAYRTGRLSEEHYEESIKYIEAIKLNHERLAYVMYLLTKRKKYAKKVQVPKAEVIENIDSLNSLKEMKEGK